MKSILIAIQVLGVLLFALNQKQDIKITHDAPASMKPGEEAVVTITLDKSDVMGFAKYQLSADNGITVELVEGAGASFTFNNQVAKLIWMSLPSDGRITLKLRLKAAEGALGGLRINQRFSYIYNNERKNYDAPPHDIMVGDGAALSAKRIQESIADKSKNLQAQVYTQRKLKSTGINQWRVDIEIDKNQLMGFAKIEETVPEGYTVIDLKSSDAVFSVDNEAVKYMWYDFPESDVVTVSYKLLPLIAMEGERPTISGTFSFLKDDETISIAIGEDIQFEGQDGEEMAHSAVKESEKSDISDDEIVAELEESLKEEASISAIAKSEEDIADAQEIPEPAKPAAPATTTPAKEAPKTEKAVEKKVTAKQDPEPEQKPKTTTEKAYTDANIVDVPLPETGVFYRVQIAAGKNNLQPKVFSKLYHFDEGFKLESHGSWLKYTTGHHQVYKAARNDRERIKTAYTKFQGPFVTAYNDGVRITVQEALMITSQKWVP